MGLLARTAECALWSGVRNAVYSEKAAAPSRLLLNAFSHPVARSEARSLSCSAICLARPIADEIQEAGLKPIFLNRNPRNLEFLGIAKKRNGWRFQYPRKDYYHKLIFEKTAQHTAARVEHWTGKTVLSASTKEWAIAKQLYSNVDISAAENIGRLIARRSLQAGINQVRLGSDDLNFHTPKFQAFYTALKEGGLELKEPRQVDPEYEFGTDYDRLQSKS